MGHVEEKARLKLILNLYQNLPKETKQQRLNILGENGREAKNKILELIESFPVLKWKKKILIATLADSLKRLRKHC